MWYPHVAFVTRNGGWYTDGTLDVQAGKVFRDSTRYIIDGGRPPRFMTRYFEADIADAHDIFGPSKNLAACFVDGLDLLAYCTGRSYVPRQSPWNIGQDALDALISGEQVKIEAPSYYVRVSLPLARQRAMRPRDMSDGTPDGMRKWTVVYDHLLLRLMAHFTRDPLLIRLFTDETLRRENPVAVLADRLDIDPLNVLPLLVYLMLGEDEAAMRRLYPAAAEYLPESPEMLRVAKVDKVLPTMRFGFMQAHEEHNMGRAPASLYGRRGMGGLSLAEKMDFHYFGSKRDLVEVAMATMINLGSRAHEVVEDGFARTVITGWYNADDAYVGDIEDAANLMTPLAVPLDPRVVRE